MEKNPGLPEVLETDDEDENHVGLAGLDGQTGRLREKGFWAVWATVQETQKTVWFQYKALLN